MTTADPTNAPPLSPLTPEQPQLPGAQVTTREAQLQSLVDIYSQTLDAISDLVLVKGPQSRIVYANKAFRDFYGMTLEELRDLIDAPFNNPDYTQQYVKEDAHVFNTGETLQIYAEPVTGHDGVVVFFDTVKSPIRDAAGTIIRTVGVARDVSERKRFENEETRFFNLAPDLLCTVVDSHFQRLNAAWEQVLGYTHAEIRAESLMSFIHPDDRAATAATATQLAQHNVIVAFENRYRHKDGSYRWLSWTATTYPGEALIYGYARDITVQKQASAEREQLQETIIQTQQAALRELSSPLMPIAEGVVAMPLIGSIDSRRAQEVMEALLNGVAETRAQTAIIDITGIPLVDTQVANTFLQAARGVNLLGAQVILTGIRPEVAQTLVSLGVDLRQIVTRSTLQSGIAYALAGRMGEEARE